MFGALSGRWLPTTTDDGTQGCPIRTRRKQRRRRARIRDLGSRVKKKPPAETGGILKMGGTRLELVTSTMSTWRSNQLS